MDRINELLSIQQKLSGVRKECDEHSDEFAKISTAMSSITRAITVIEKR